MNHQNLANLTTQYQQVYLVYCYKVMQCLQALAWLAEQQSTKVKPKSALGVKKSTQKVNQQKTKLKSLKHQEKSNVNTIVALGFPNGAMSAAFRVAFNEFGDKLSKGNAVIKGALEILDPAGPHSHKFKNFACNDTFQSGCTEANLFDKGLLFAGAPESFSSVVFGTTSRDKPVSDGQKLSLWMVGDIQVFVDRDNWSITNQTLVNHVLHKGTVTRSIVREGHNLFIQTEGRGFGSGPNINDYFAPVLWDGVDSAVVNKAGVYPRTR